MLDSPRLSKKSSIRNVFSARVKLGAVLIEGFVLALAAILGHGGSSALPVSGSDTRSAAALIRSQGPYRLIGS